MEKLQQQFSSKKIPPLSPRYLVDAVAVAFIAAVCAHSTAVELELEEVIVTAQKRQQEALTVPLTVNIFSAESIETTGALRLSDIDAYIPGFEADDRSLTQAGYTVRGISSPNISTGGDPSVATFYDEVYLPRAATTIAFADMARVEVLKGPQGTLFGRNAAAGIINIVPNQPSFEFESFVGLKLGNFDLFRVEGMVNAVLSESVYLRANLLSNHRNGFVENVGPASDDTGAQSSFAGRLALLWNLDSATSLQLAYDGDNIDNAPPQSLGISDFAFSKNPFSGKVGNDVIDGEETRDMHAVTAKLNHRVDESLSFKVIASYRDFETTNREDEDGTADATRYLDSNNEEDSDIYYSEVQLRFANDRYDWIVGGTYSRENVQQATTVTALADSITRLVTKAASGGSLGHLWNPDQMSLFLAGVGISATPAQIVAAGDFYYDALGNPMIFGPSFASVEWAEQVENSGDFSNWGVFADIDISFNERWNLIAGLRYSRDKKEFTWFTPLTTFAAQRAGVSNQIFSPSEGFTATDQPLKARDDWSKLTGRLVGKYQISDAVMTFASYSTGYKSGGFDSLDLSSASSPLEPEESTNYEWGVKGHFLDRRLRTQFSIFYFELDNRQRSVDTKPPGHTSAIPQVINGDQEFNGAELTADWLATPLLRLGLITTYRDEESQWDTFYNASGELQTDKDSVSSDTAYTLTFDWSPSVPAGTVIVHLDYVFQEDSVESAPDYLPEYAQIPHYGEDRKLLNARIAWSSDNGSYRIALWGKNILDNDYVDGVRNISTDSFGTRFAIIHEPSIWGVDIKYFY